MRFLFELIGLAMILFSWFNPFGLDMMIRVLIFLLGFDMFGIIPKIAIFVIDYLFGFAWLGWTLLIMVAAEAIVMLISKKINLIVKPVAIFAVSYLALGLQPALITAGIDLLLNIGMKK